MTETYETTINGEVWQAKSRWDKRPAGQGSAGRGIHGIGQSRGLCISGQGGLD